MRTVMENTWKIHEFITSGSFYVRLLNCVASQVTETVKRETPDKQASGGMLCLRERKWWRRRSLP